MRVLHLAQTLRDAGLDVEEVPGWETRGADGLLDVGAMICHHTATPASRKGDLPTLDLLINGRSDLPGPLCQLALGRSGTWYVIASGKANHAGVGEWNGVTTSRRTLGTECEAPGTATAKWPQVQSDAYDLGAAALLAKEGLTAVAHCGHREWAEPRGRKPDPVPIDLAAQRARIQRLIDDPAVPTPTPAPTKPTAEDFMYEHVIVDGTGDQYVVGANGVRGITSMKAVEALKHFGYIRPGAPRKVSRTWLDSMARATAPYVPKAG